jgi:hypothetical protein
MVTCALPLRVDLSWKATALIILHLNSVFFGEDKTQRDHRQQLAGHAP